MNKKLAALALVGISTPSVAAAPSRPTIATYAIAAQDLASALKLFASISGREVVTSSELVAGKLSAPVSGAYTADKAAARMLAGTGLTFIRVNGAYVLRPLSFSVGAATDEPSQDIVVTGTRIKGAVIASSVVTIGREQVRDLARSDLGEVARRIPQSFGGGQNPGIGNNVPTASGADVGGGSSLNLRGLGSDATLTLLNGRRLAYTAAIQSIDVSAIPLGAVERIEVVPDGASAIYGSDAVAGVANIILRRDFDGLESGARLAATSDGGGFQQRYDAVAGHRWSSGGFMAAVEHGSNTAIRAVDRSYAATRAPGLDLYPALRHDSVVVSGYQGVGDITFSIDALYNDRRSRSVLPTQPGGDLDKGRATFFSKDRAFGLAPAVEVALTSDWFLTLEGTFGGERVDFHQVECTGSACTDGGANFYRNRGKSVELSARGTLLSLPGGPVKLAAGGGYRAISFERFSAALSAVNTKADQKSGYGYGELALPVVGPDQGLILIRRFDLNLAGRYEHYAGIGGVFTPKLGAAWELTPDLTLKGSWGRSFRAPTLFQQFQPRAAALYPPRFIGAPGLPNTAAALLVLGGNPALKPERATTWSGTVAIHPKSLPGLSFEASYFDVAYRQRIVSPIALLAQALSNPLYANQVTRNPNPALQAAVIASASSFTNFTGVPYDPANVIAIVDDAYVNAGRQTARGVDFLAHYDAALNSGDRLAFSTNVSYLDSSQRLTALQPVTPLAGNLFNPPHWRGNATASWTRGALTLTAAADYIGGVRDARFDPVVRVRGMTTVDLSARYRLSDGPALLRNLELTASVQNLFNAKPDPIAVTAPYDTPYDSTNYSPIGRLIAVEVRKSW